MVHVPLESGVQLLEGGRAAQEAARPPVHVLIVEDDSNARTLYARYLSRGPLLASEGVDAIVHPAASGEEALAIAASGASGAGRIAYAVVDFRLTGGMDGIDTIRGLWEIDGETHCALVTGVGASVEDEIEGRLKEEMLDHWDYLAKPFTAFELRTRVRRGVATWLARQAKGRREMQNRALESALRDLERAQAQLLQQEKMASIGQLAAGVAHELNNPIGYVHSNLGTLGRYFEKIQEMLAAYELRLKPGAAPAREALEALRKRLKIEFVLEDLPSLLKESLEGTERVRKIVSDLKVFSHPAESDPKYSDLTEGLKSTLNIVWNELKYKAELRTEFGELPPVRCVEGQINQVFMNLLVNAGQAIVAGGVITLRTRVEGAMAVFEFADNGCGIPPENLHRIFDPFFTTKPVGKGTGLGLAISLDIARKHGGTLDVVSELGKGTCFTIRLPVDGTGGKDA
ncbi:MAG: ATP-binding protein [Planctomycetaceae bacterium]